MLLLDFLFLFILHQFGHLIACLYYGFYEGDVTKLILYNTIPDHDKVTLAQRFNIHSFGVVLGAVPFLWIGDFSPAYFYGINYFAVFYFLTCLDDFVMMLSLPILGWFTGLSWDEKVSDLIAECKSLKQMMKSFGGMT